MAAYRAGARPRRVPAACDDAGGARFREYASRVAQCARARRLRVSGQGHGRGRARLRTPAALDAQDALLRPGPRVAEAARAPAARLPRSTRALHATRLARAPCAAGGRGRRRDRCAARGRGPGDGGPARRGRIRQDHARRRGLPRRARDRGLRRRRALGDARPDAEPVQRDRQALCRAHRHAAGLRRRGGRGPRARPQARRPELPARHRRRLEEPRGATPARRRPGLRPSGHDAARRRCARRPRRRDRRDDGRASRAPAHGPHRVAGDRGGRRRGADRAPRPLAARHQARRLGDARAHAAR